MSNEIMPREDETPHIYEPRVDRRTALTWVGIVGAAAAAGSTVVACAPKVGGQQAKGYGTDPNLVKPAPAPWARVMTAGQLQAAAAVADHVLPASGSAPAASALGIPDFLNEWVSAPYPDQVKDAKMILPALDRLRSRALGDYGKEPTLLTAAQRAALMAPLADPKGRDIAVFKRLRRLVIGAYYTTPQGFKDIGYIGNVARAKDPGPSAEVMAQVERELAKLGL
jgi:hypothetical protein